MSTTAAPTLQEQVAAHQGQVQALLRTAIDTSGDGLHTLVLLQWDGSSSATVLVGAGRAGQLELSADQPLLLGVEMAAALGHLALGLCASEQPEALPFPHDSGASAGASRRATASAALLCPVGCGTTSRQRALLLSLYDQRPSGAGERQLRRQQELLLIARRLGELLADDDPGSGHGKRQ
jgi:hypothetical protein